MIFATTKSPKIFTAERNSLELEKYYDKIMAQIFPHPSIEHNIKKKRERKGGAFVKAICYSKRTLKLLMLKLSHYYFSASLVLELRVKSCL